MPCQRQGHQCARQERIGRTHYGEQVAVTDAIADHAEQRGNQRTDVAKRGKQGQQQHRSGLDQHIPAENQRLHLERPGCEQVGGPLETIIPVTEGCERGRARQLAQNSMPRFIAFHPAPFLIGARSTASRRPRPAPARFRKKAGALSRSPRLVVNPALSRTRRGRRRAELKSSISPANPTMKARQSGPTKPYPDQDTADLTNPEVPGLNRLSNHHLHSRAQI